MRRSDVYPSNYVKCEDLKGKDVTVRIKDVTVEKLGDDEKPVCWFYQKDKGLVLNQTNWDTIEDLHGPESDDWLGKSIVIYPARVMFAGKKVDAIRVREWDPTQPRPNGTSRRTAEAVQREPVQREPGEDDGVEDQHNDDLGF